MHIYDIQAHSSRNIIGRYFVIMTKQCYDLTSHLHSTHSFRTSKFSSWLWKSSTSFVGLKTSSLRMWIPWQRQFSVGVKAATETHTISMKVRCILYSVSWTAVYKRMRCQLYRNWVQCPLSMLQIYKTYQVAADRWRSKIRQCVLGWGSHRADK